MTSSKTSQQSTRPPKRKNNPHRSYKQIAIIFIILAILLILGVTYITLSKVTITITPANEPVTYNFDLTISQNPQNNTSTQVILPGLVTSKQQQISDTFSVEDGQTIQAKAEGTVTLYNDRNVAQTLVATTRLLTPDNVLFRLKNRVTIPANLTIQAEVAADQEGEIGNIGPTTFTIPGLSEDLQGLVYAKSTTPMAGGLRTIGILTENDIQKAEQELIKSASSNIMAQFLEEAEQKKYELLDTQRQLNNLSYEEELGSEIDSFGLTGDLTLNAVFANKKEILELAKTKLKQSQGSRSEFIQADPSTLNYTVKKVDPQNNQAVLNVSISGLSTVDADKNMFNKELLVGFTEEDLKLYFSQFESIQSIHVEFSPFWVKKAPLLTDHIHIKIAE